MTAAEFLARIAGPLTAAGVPFMVAGSFASGYHGHPRATNDLDLVIDPTPEQFDRFLAALGDDLYVAPDAARDALRSRFQFNVIDFANGWKVDLIVRKDRPFSVSEFARRTVARVSGDEYPMASAEDVVLAKLEWDRMKPVREAAPGRPGGPGDSARPAGPGLPAALGCRAGAERPAGGDVEAGGSVSEQ